MGGRWEIGDGERNFNRSSIKYAGQCRLQNRTEVGPP